MERRKQFQNEKQDQDLYQYEMGIELGADVEAEKRNHRNEYDREHSSSDFKNDFNNNQMCIRDSRIRLKVMMGSNIDLMILLLNMYH